MTGSGLRTVDEDLGVDEPETAGVLGRGAQPLPRVSVVAVPAVLVGQPDVVVVRECVGAVMDAPKVDAAGAVEPDRFEQVREPLRVAVVGGCSAVERVRLRCLGAQVGDPLDAERVCGGLVLVGTERLRNCAAHGVRSVVRRFA